MDELVRRVSVEDVMRFYGVPFDAIQRVGDEVRTRCFLNCSKTEPTGDRTLAIKIEDDAKKWCCHRYECEHKRGGNLVGLIDLVKPGDHMNGRPRGERFKAILADLKEIAGGTPLSAQPAVAGAPAKPRVSEPVKVNLPLVESLNERARTVVDLHEKFVVDPMAMSPSAASYFRRRPYLTPELCAKWKVGYLPHNTGGDKTGGSMRGRICYPVHDEQGRVLTWFGRDPQFEEKYAIWQAGDRSGVSPEKCHFVKGYHRGLEVLGQHRLADPATREAIQALRHVIVVEGPNDAIRLDALGVPAFAVCSNRITTAQADRIARWCRELGVTAAVLFDADPEGDAGGQQAVIELAQRCPVRLAWSRTMFDGRFKDRQPENVSGEEWEFVRTALVA
ncbi:MAG: hypothetical protein JNK76_24460 [Planctomycetales bacterium]|nr:hypothetical protein [Planctomycetales bacterium]MBN8626658.1 hypothetical protein [Planctomycetota bacterium]